MKILLTGGTGFIGSHLVKKLINSGQEIVLLKRSVSNTSRITDLLSQVKPYNIDQTDLEQVFVTEKPDLIIHLATKYIKANPSHAEVKEMSEVNIVLPTTLLRLAEKHGVKYFINTGTCFEYKLSNEPISEENLIEPYNDYAETKVKFEEVLRKSLKKSSLRAVTLKLFYPYGEKDNRKLIPIIMDSFILNTAFSLTKGEQKLNLTYVEDIVEAYMKTIEFMASDRYENYEVFNIGSDKAYSVKEVVSMVEKIAGKPTQLQFTYHYALNEIMYMNCDNTKAKERLGWKTKNSIEQGLTKTYSFYIKNSK